MSTDKEAKREETLSNERWKTKDGFVFPGFKSSIEANQQRKEIHPARLEELYKVQASFGGTVCEL